MMKSWKVQLVVLVTLLLLVTGWTSANQTRTTTWEYKVVLGQTGNGPENEQIMNKAGGEGWELVGSERFRDSFPFTTSNAPSDARSSIRAPI
jgi:uncharacterized protein DUF4177